MLKPPSVPADGVMPDLGDPRVRPVRGSPARAADDVARVTLQVVHDRDRIASGLNDVVVRRLFSAGLALEMAMQLMGDHQAVANAQQALAELDLAIRDIRNVVFDHHQDDLGSDERPKWGRATTM
jgi:signal transduction histidine kinase